MYMYTAYLGTSAPLWEHRNAPGNMGRFEGLHAWCRSFARAISQLCACCRGRDRQGYYA